MIKNRYLVSLINAIILFLLLVLWSDEYWLQALVITTIVTAVMLLLDPLTDKLMNKLIPWVIDKLGLGK